jgi:hypothetical protein
MKNTLLLLGAMLPFVVPGLLCAFVLQPVDATTDVLPPLDTVEQVAVPSGSLTVNPPTKKVGYHHMPKRVVRAVTCDPVVHTLGGSYQRCR